MKLGRLEGTHEARADVSMGPLIDIVFILLIFFVVTSTFKDRRVLELERPASASNAADKGSRVEVGVDAFGRLSVAGTLVSPWELQERVGAALREGDSQSILLQADAAVRTQMLVKVVDACKAAGASRVALSVKAP